MAVYRLKIRKTPAYILMIPALHELNLKRYHCGTQYVKIPIFGGGVSYNVANESTKF